MNDAIVASCTTAGPGVVATYGYSSTVCLLIGVRSWDLNLKLAAWIRG